MLTNYKYIDIYLFFILNKKIDHLFFSVFFSFSAMNNHSIHVAKLFIFVLFLDPIWEIIVAQFRAAVMPMQTVFLHSVFIR